MTVTLIMNDAPSLLAGHIDGQTPVLVVGGDDKPNGISVADKIDIDSVQQESDVRHEPRPPLKSAELDDASIVPQVGTPLDPSMPCWFCSSFPLSHSVSP